MTSNVNESKAYGQLTSASSNPFLTIWLDRSRWPPFQCWINIFICAFSHEWPLL